LKMIYILGGVAKSLIFVCVKFDESVSLLYDLSNKPQRL
jgi:hypothetical protein